MKVKFRAMDFCGNRRRHRSHLDPLMNQPSLPKAIPATTPLRKVHARTYGWGRKARVSGASHNIVGRVKEGLGRVAGR